MSESIEDPIDDPMAEEAIAWFARIHSDGRTRADEDRFAHWMKQSDAHTQAYARIEQLYRAAGPQMTPRPLAANKRNKRLAVVWAAAAAVSVLGIGLAFLSTHENLIVAGSFATPAGGRQELKLGDGSTVTLNTRSEVSVEIGEHSRIVRLTRGEARFNVAKDPTRPFIVDTGYARVRALGTAFDVRVSTSRVAVTLVEGKVEVARTAGQGIKQPVILTAGQQLAFEIAGGGQQVRTVNAERANAWLKHQLIFDALALSEAVEEVNRYLSNPIVIQDRSIGNIRISGVVRAGSVESFISSLETSFPIEAVQTSNGPALIRKPD